MEIQSYIEGKRGKKPSQEIVERWQTRVLARGLEKMGEAGARQYLADYGRGIAAPKCILLAIQAESTGYPEVAAGFWKKAFELETGQQVTGSIKPSSPAISVAAVTALTPALRIPGFPANMQPGALVTMQPVDGQRNREYYITNPNYWGQPKRDGNKVVVFATENHIWYQSRSLKLRESPSLDMDDALKGLAKNLGSFILEGELYYQDVDGKEHRTSAQAATYNIEVGKPGVLPVMRYAVFSCLYLDGKNLQTQKDRVIHGISVSTLLRETPAGAALFETLYYVSTEENKRALAESQQKEGREGEVWFDYRLPYFGGKRKDDSYVRTKYITELEVVMTNLTSTTAAGRPFGAIEVSSLEGKPLGSIGTGFSLDQMREITQRFTSGQRKIVVATQGFTENGNLFLGRFVEVA